MASMLHNRLLMAHACHLLAYGLWGDAQILYLLDSANALTASQLCDSRLQVVVFVLCNEASHANQLAPCLPQQRLYR